MAGWAWIPTELRVPVPMIDMRLMRRRGMWTANVVAGAMGFATFAAFGFIPQLLQTPTEAGYGFGASITESGYLLLPSAAASFVVGFTTARLIAWMGARVVIGSGLMLAGRLVPVHRLLPPGRPGSCTPRRPSRASAPAWSSPASPAW